jgi:hypothetical protein
MRCLNSPPILNSLETKIVESIPASARHVLVVNAGDGRLARAVIEKLGAGAKASVVTVIPEMASFVDDLADVTDKAWDINWYAAQVAKHGAFDCIVLYQLHEFWHGELRKLQRLLALAAPGARIWVSFLNAQAGRMLSRFLPPLRLGFSSMADPLRLGPNLDFASFMDFAGKSRVSMVELWGMLDSNAQAYCQKPNGQTETWDIKGVKMNVGTFADAFLWGAANVAMAFDRVGATPESVPPKISYSPYSGNLLQALLLPYPDYQTAEGMVAAAQLEVDAWRDTGGENQTLGQLARFFVEQVGGSDQPKRVLVMGAGWGRDLLLFKRQYPSWEWVGFDHQAELAGLAEPLLDPAGLKVETAPIGERLPFDDRSFDVVLSLGYFSSVYEPAAKALAKEALRVARGSIYHLEDGRGPDHSLQLRSYSLKAVYSELGRDASVSPVLVDGAAIGMYMLKLNAPT